MTRPAPEAPFAAALRARLRALPLRVLAAILVGGLAGAYVGWTVAGLWLCAMGAILALEWLLLRDVETLASRPGVGSAVIALSTGVNAAIALAGPLGGPWAMTCLNYFLAGIGCHIALVSVGSSRAFSASLAAYGLVLAGVVVEAALMGAPPANVATLAACGGVLLGLMVVMWRRSSALLAAEARARAESDLRRQEAAAARAEAERAVEAKSAFIAVVSHELRTPISAILAASAALQARAAGPDLAHARMVGEAGGMMRVLLNDLLDKAKADAGRLTVERRPVDLRELVAHQVTFWRTEARRKNLRMRLEGCRTLPRWIEADPTRLRQVLNNLLSNALKFTEQGGVTLSLACAGLDDGRLDLRLAVSDTGPGMSSDTLARLFNPFEQARDGTVGTIGGTGLGLAISRDLMRLMDGDIAVASRLGEGSCFTVAMTAAPAAPMEAAAAAPEPAAQRRLEVLVADDHPLNRQALRLILEAIGALISEAQDGSEALAALEARAFDVALLDLNMPGMTGPAIARAVRAGSGPNAQGRLIAVTGAAAEADVARCLEAGMDAHVAKPISAPELLATIAALLEADERRPADLRLAS